MDNCDVEMAFKPKNLLGTFPENYKKTFRLYTCLLKWVGIDIFGAKISKNIESCVRLSVYSIFFVPFVTVHVTLLSKITADNFMEGARVIPILVMFAIDVIKMASALTKRGEIIEIFAEIGRLWPKPTVLDDKAAVLENWLRRMGILLKLFFIYAVVNLVTFETIPLLATIYHISSGANVFFFPFQPPELWPIQSISVFLATYLWEISATIPCQLCVYLPYDLLIVTLTSNVSILFRLLQMDLQNAISKHHGSIMRHDKFSDDESEEKIKEIVKIHQRLLNIVKKLNDIFGLVIFIHVGFSSILICFFGFLTVVFGGVGETIANLLTVFNAVITIFLLALSGQLLCDTSSGVATAAYNSRWYDSDVRVKKLVLFIIIRSQRPCYLSALGFSNMNLQSFSKIMSRAWTYFSLLIQLYSEN